jgi:DNA-binding transcriptional regulator YhcF (GntR family)
MLREPKSGDHLVLCTLYEYTIQMLLTVDLASSTPVYRQIVDGLRVLLVNRQLAPGDSLPTVRRLALDLGVHFNTVAQAYRALADEGWIELARRNGARVIARLVPDAHQAELATDFQRRLEELIAELRARGYPPSRLGRDLRRAAKTLEEN